MKRIHIEQTSEKEHYYYALKYQDKVIAMVKTRDLALHISYLLDNMTEIGFQKALDNTLYKGEDL